MVDLQSVGGVRRRIMAVLVGGLLVATVLPSSPVGAVSAEAGVGPAVTEIKGSVLVPGRSGGVAGVTLDVTARSDGGHKGVIAYADPRSGAVGGGTVVRGSIERFGRNGARGRADVVEVVGGRLRRGVMGFEVDDLSALGQGADHVALRPVAPLRYANESDALAGDLRVLPVAGGAPSGTVSIDAGAAFSVDRDVVLDLGATDDGAVVAMRIADGGDPGAAAWQAYATSAPWTLPEGDGTKVVSVQFADVEGNVSAVVSDAIVLDTTAPSITAVTGDVEVGTGEDVTVSVTATDANGIGSVVFVRPGGSPESAAMTGAGGDTYTATVAGVTDPFDYYVAVTDVPGNQAASPAVAPGALHHVSVSSEPGDVTPPAGTVEIDGGAEVTAATAVLLGLDASDDVAVTEMRVADGGDPSAAAWQPYVTSLAWTVPSGDGAKTVSVQFRDAAGNVSTVASDSIDLDATAPAGSLSVEAGATHTATRSVTLTLAGTDAGGVTQMRVADGTDPSAAAWEPYVVARNWTLPESDGEKTVSAQFRDAAGNVSPVVSDAIVLDTTKPEVTVSINGGAATTTSTAVDLSLAGTDAGSPLMVRVADGEDPSGGSWQALVDHLAWTLPAGDGDKIVSVQVRDPAGNISGVASDAIALDATGPTLTDPTGDVSADPGDDVVVGVDATDAHGVAAVDLLSRPVGSSDPFTRIGLTRAAGDRWEVTLNGVTADLDYYFEASDDLANLSRSPADAPTHVFRVDVAGGSVFEAPPLDRSQPANLFDATAFLYSGPSPTQVGMTATIEPRRAALLRGVVRDLDGSPHPGARVVVVGHPEYGETTTRADGAYDLVINGGAQMAVEVSHEGHVTVQRDAPSAWGEWVMTEDIVLTPLDGAHTEVDFGAVGAQVHQASPVSDADGTRRSTVVVEPSTTAEMVLPDGTTQPLAGGTLRVTELTVGETGEQAMPGELPEQSAYTYAAEYSLDEATAAGAESVDFSKPVITYVDDFLGFPAGTTVPAGWYDRDRATWVAGPSGRVIKILTEAAGTTTVDTDGDSVADTGTDGLTISAAELARLAGLYEPGDVLWRVGLDHFSAWDLNWGAGPPEDAVFPANAEDPEIDDSECPPSPGSAVYCADQTLGEAIPIAGTPWSLNYRSDRHPTPERYTLRIPVSGATVPASLRRITVTVTVVGRRFVVDRPATPDTEVTIVWDGLDPYGRTVNGEQLAKVDIAYWYGANYEATAAFGYNGGGRIEGDPTRQEISLHQRYVRSIGAWDDAGFGLGGWSLTPLHAFDPTGGTVNQGDGTSRRLPPAGGDVILPFAGAQSATATPDGTPADGTFISDAVRATAVAPDGTVYYTESCRVRAISPSGIVTTVAGSPLDPLVCAPNVSGLTGTQVGDGLPATSALLAYPHELAVMADGTLLIGDGTFRIRRVDADGVINTVAGTGVDAWAQPVPAPAITQPISSLRSLTAMPDGGFAYSEWWSLDSTTSAIRRVLPGGSVDTVAGGCQSNCRQMYTTVAEPGSWNATDFKDVSGEIAALADGSIVITNGYFSNFGGVVGNSGWDVKVLSRGELRRLAYHPSLGPEPETVAVGPSGAVFMGGRWGVFEVLGDSVVQRAGIEGDNIATKPPLGPGGAMAMGRPTQNGLGLSVTPAGDLLIGNFIESGSAYWFTIERVTSGLPGFSGAALTVPSPDGTTVGEFTSAGTLVRTVDASTGVTVLSVDYGAHGYVTGLVDRNGRRTVIERDGTGRPTAIVAPGGQRTVLTVGADGLLQTVTDPTGRTTALTHGPKGLLTQLVDPAGETHVFEYDSGGRLVADTSPGRGRATLSLSTRPNGATVTYTSPSGRPTSYAYDTAAGVTTRRVTAPGGVETVTTTTGTKRRVQRADGTTITQTLGADPRFGTVVPLVTRTDTAYPNGTTRTETMTRTVTRDANSQVVSMRDAYTVGGVSGESRIDWDAASRTITVRTPDGRTLVTELDALGRPWRVTRLGLSADVSQYTYDARGRVITVTQGASVLTAVWGADDLPVRMVDATGQEVRFAWDPAGRLTGFDGPGTADWTFGYDSAGRRDRVTNPAGGSHQLDFDPSGLLLSHLAPDAAAPLAYTYDADGRRAGVTQPDGRSQAYGRDTAGQIISITSPDAVVAITQVLTDGRTRPSLVRRTPAGGVAQDLAIETSGPLVTATEMAGPAAARFAYQRNPAGLLSQITLTSGTDTVTMGRTYYGTSGRATDGPVSYSWTSSAPMSLRTTAVAGMSGQFNYGPTGRFSSRLFRVSNVRQFEETLTLDAGRRVTRVVEQFGADPAVTWDYERDALGRLWRVSRDGALFAEYGYDADGNRTSMPAGTATYDRADHLTSLNGAAVTVDGNGFLTAEPGATYAYDSRGQMVSATVGGQSVTYTYDGLGRRVTRTDAGGTTQYLYGDPDESFQLTASRDASGGLTVYHYDDGGRLTALQRGGVVHAVATDRLGSPRLVRSSTGTVVRTATWDPTGRTLGGSGTFDLAIGWGGGIVDPVTGLVRFGMRDYDPDTGRWTTPDPTLFHGGSTNLYTHAGDDPVSMVDRAGTFSIEGSVYEGLGGGGKLSITGEGISICAEVGVGFGVSAGVSVDGGLDPSGVTGFAELQAGVGQLAVALRGQKALTGAGSGCPGQLNLKACAIACANLQVFPPEGDEMFRAADGLPSLEPQLDSLSGLEPASPKALSVQAKMGVSGCASFGW